MYASHNCIIYLHVAATAEARQEDIADGYCKVCC